MMETPPQASTSYQLHQVIPAENIVVQPSTPPTAAQLLLPHLPAATPGTSGLNYGRSRVSESEMAEQYRLKYMVLKKKCHGIQLGNEKLLNRLYHVRKAVRKLTRERRFLMSKLDEFGDDYRSAQLPIPIEDESVLSLMSSVPSTYSPPKEGATSSGTKRSASPVDSEKSSKSSSSKTTLSVKTPTVSPAGPKRRRSSAQNRADKEKDPNAPKKPANAFLMFCQQERLSVLEWYSKQNPNAAEMSHQDLTKELAKKWNDLTADEKKTYYTMYEQDKRRYEREMRQYRMSETNKSAKTIPSTTATQIITTPLTTVNITTTPSTPSTQPATIALTSATMSQAKPASIQAKPATVQMMAKPVVTTVAPSVVSAAPPPASVVVKQEPMNNNNSVTQTSVGATKLPQTQVTPAVTTRTQPASTITFSKPSSTVIGHQLVTLTTSPATSSMIQGATTNYIKLSLGPALPLSSNPNILVPPPKTGASSAVAMAKTIPVTFTTKKGEPVTGVGQISRQGGAVVTKVRGQAGNKVSGQAVSKHGGQAVSKQGGSGGVIKSEHSGKVSKRSGQATIASRLSSQAAALTAKGVGQIITTTKSGGLVTMSVKNVQPVTKSSTQIVKSGVVGLGAKSGAHLVARTIPQGALTTKSSGFTAAVTKSGSTAAVTKGSGQGSLGVKTIGQAVVVSKIGGQATFSLLSKPSGQATFSLSSKPSGQAAFSLSSKPSGQATFSLSSKPSGQATFSLSSKPSGQANISTTKVGQVTTVSKLSTQPIVSTKPVGQQGTMVTGSRLSGQGLPVSAQGISAAAMLSRLAAPGGNRSPQNRESPTTSSTLPSSRLTTTTIHGESITHVAKETKKLLMGGQKPVGSPSSSMSKKSSPEPMDEDDDPYHFDD